MLYVMSLHNFAKFVAGLACLTQSENTHAATCTSISLPGQSLSLSSVRKSVHSSKAL